MKEKGMMFKPYIIQAILDDKKSVTRRVIKPQPQIDGFGDHHKSLAIRDLLKKCRYGDACKKDRLYVKEAWCYYYGGKKAGQICYKADRELNKREKERDCIELKWKSPMFMPKKYARIWLELTAVRIEKLQNITEEDAEKEGAGKFRYPLMSGKLTYRNGFRFLWDSIAKSEYKWEKNPWVYCLYFKRIKP